MKSQDWHVKQFDREHGSFEQFRELVYEDINAFHEEALDEKRKELEKEDKAHILELEKEDKAHILDLEKFKIEKKKLDIESEMMFYNGFRPAILIISLFVGIALMIFLIKKYARDNNSHRNESGNDRRRYSRGNLTISTRNNNESLTTSTQL